MEIVVLGYRFCPNCDMAYRFAKRFAKEFKIGFRYMLVFEDDYATRLYNEAVKHGFSGVPQTYLIVDGVEYFIMLGIPDTYEEFKKVVLRMLEHYGVKLG